MQAYASPTQTDQRLSLPGITPADIVAADGGNADAQFALGVESQQVVLFEAEGGNWWLGV
ncbi:MAG: hypothetical protein Alpg2KO_33760 [Alphaproteobacteria bacterium]